MIKYRIIENILLLAFLQDSGKQEGSLSGAVQELKSVLGKPQPAKGRWIKTQKTEVPQT